MVSAPRLPALAVIVGSRPDRSYASAEHGRPVLQSNTLAPALRWQDRGHILVSRAKPGCEPQTSRKSLAESVMLGTEKSRTASPLPVPSASYSS